MGAKVTTLPAPIMKKPLDPEAMALQNLARILDDAMFPEPEEYCLMKNFKSTCPPVIRNSGAFGFGGVSKTLHLTEEVFRERVRSMGDTEILSPDNKYIENNYETMLDMQLVENASHGPTNFPTKFPKEDLSEKSAVVKILPAAVQVSTPMPIHQSLSFVQMSAPASAPSPSPAHIVVAEPESEPEADPPRLDAVGQVDETEDVIMDESVQADKNTLELENVNVEETPEDDKVIEIPEEPSQQTNIRKSTAMPLSVKITRQVQPQISDDTPIVNPPSPVRVYLDFTKKSYVKLVRLTELQIRRVSRKRTQLSPESPTALEYMASENSEKHEDNEIPQQKRHKSNHQTICQMLSRSACLDDDYDDDNCSTSTEKSESRTDYQAEDENPLPSLPETSNKDQPSRKPSKPNLMEFNIFDIPRPQKKTPSNYRDKYNRVIFQKEQNNKRPNSQTNNVQNSAQSSDGSSRHSGSPHDNNSSHSTTKSSSAKPDKYNKSANRSKLKSRSDSQSSTNNEKDPLSGRPRSEKPNSKRGVGRPRTQKEIELEKRKLRNRQNLANSTKTGCFQISGEAEHLKEYKIPKKTNTVKRNNVKFFENAETNTGSDKIPESTYIEEDFRRKPSEKYCKTQNMKKGKSEISKINSTNGGKKSTSKQSLTPEPVEYQPQLPEYDHEDDNSRGSDHSLGRLSRAPGEVDDSPVENTEVIRFQIQGQEFEGREEDIVPFNPWDNVRLPGTPGNLQVLEHENTADGVEGSYYYTLAPGPTNESNQIVEVQVAEGDSYFIMEPEGGDIECIGEVEVQTTNVEDNQSQNQSHQVSVITTVESKQTQSGEITTTTVHDPKVPTRYSDEESGTPPPPLANGNGANLANKITTPKKNWQTGSVSGSASSRSSCGSSCSTNSDTDSESD